MRDASMNGWHERTSAGGAPPLPAENVALDTAAAAASDGAADRELFSGAVPRRTSPRVAAALAPVAMAPIGVTAGAAALDVDAASEPPTAAGGASSGHEHGTVSAISSEILEQMTRQ